MDGWQRVKEHQQRGPPKSSGTSSGFQKSSPFDCCVLNKGVDVPEIEGKDTNKYPKLYALGEYLSLLSILIPVVHDLSDCRGC